MKLLDHPDHFKDGCRVLMLVTRTKDTGKTAKPVIRVTNSIEEFDETLYEFEESAYEGQRVYASASPRNVATAIRTFKERQLRADYDSDPHDFYLNISARWKSCLMSNTNVIKDEKYWLLDIDEDDDQDFIGYELERHYDFTEYSYWYPTKSGHHVILKPFNLNNVDPAVVKKIDKNPMMLWAF